jgi:hypothetical protein
MDELGFPIDSEYVEYQSFFEEFPESSPKEVIVWTESDDDIRLWMQVFIDNENYTFTFLPASKFQTDDGVSANGCSRLIKLCDSQNIIPGKQNIVCLDSDFKFVSRLSSTYIGRDYSMPHFYWTCVHSKEHIFLECGLVDDIVSHSSCTPLSKLEQRTEDVYCAISHEIYSPLSSIIFLMSQNFDELSDEVERFKIQFREGLFVLLSLKKGIIDFSTCEIWKSFSQVTHELDKSLEAYISTNYKLADLVSFREELSRIGISSANMYLFIRGHDWESVAKHLTKCYLDMLLEQKLQEVSLTSKNVKKDIQAIRNKTPKLEQALLSVKPRVDSFPFFEDTVRQARVVYGT